MQSAYRIGATLETIPTELKLEIASHLDPDVPNDLRWSKAAQHDAQSHRAAIRSFSLVSRSWAAALAGQRWQVRLNAPSFVAPSRGKTASDRIQLKHSLTRQTLRLRVADLKSLLELARDWIPRYGTKVKTVQLTWWTHDELRDLRRIYDTPGRQQALGVAERFTGLQPPSSKVLLRTFDLHDALVAWILQACSNFLHIKLIEQTLMPAIVCAETNEHNEISIRSGPSSGRTRCALQVAGSRISAADLSFERFVLAAESTWMCWTWCQMWCT